MRKIDLTSYEITVRTEDGKVETRPYNVRSSCVELCFIPPEGCSKFDLLKRDKIARKIADEPTDAVLLEDADWKRLNEAIDALKALGKNDVELVRRIVEAAEVPVQEK